jgi:5'-3' exonuclease
LIIDLNHLAYRNWCTNGTLSTTSGEKTGVAFGVLRSLRLLCDSFHPSQVVFCRDVGSSFRKEMLASYKASRAPQTDQEKSEKQDFYNQLDQTVALLECLGLPVMWYDGLEADDLCAIICKHFPKLGDNIVVSGDKDLLQLVNSDNKYYHPLYNKLVSLSGCKLPQDISKFAEVWGHNKEIHPDVFTYKSEKLSKCVPFDRWLLYRSLVGDSSDELKGINGIGEVTALKIVSECADIKEIMSKKDHLTFLSQRQKEALTESELLLQFSLIDLNLVSESGVIEEVLQALKNQSNPKRNEDSFCKLLIRYQMTSIVSDIHNFLKNIPFYENLYHC